MDEARSPDVCFVSTAGIIADAGPVTFPPGQMETFERVV